MTDTNAEAVPFASSARGATDFLGHPRGLAFIAGTELSERVSFYGMQALLVLYMVEYLLTPGHIEHVTGLAGLRAGIEHVTGPLSSQALATQVFGLYIGLVYFTPVFGGLLGDRVLGKLPTIVLGAVLMTIGHFCMAFESLFLLALALLILGAGALRGNLISQVGSLYADDDPRRERAFQIYYAIVNTGMFFAPLITGTLAKLYGWRYGFAFAGLGMLAGLLLYLSGAKHLPPEPQRAKHLASERLTGRERRVLLTILLMLPLFTLFWIAQTQVWNTYNLWARDHVNLVVLGWGMPVPWLQAIDGLAAIVMVPPVLLLWRWQATRGREPDDVTKIALGCLLFAAALAWLGEGGFASERGGRVPLLWALLFHVLSNTGYVYFTPTAVAIISRSAPPTVNAMTIGAYYLTIFLGSAISGRLGGLYEKISPDRFWLTHAAIVAVGGLAIWVLAPRLRRELARA